MSEAASSENRRRSRISQNILERLLLLKLGTGTNPCILPYLLKLDVSSY